MDDFEEKLNSILASPETMGQIMALADSITSQSEETPAESRPDRSPPRLPLPILLPCCKTWTRLC